MEETKAMENTVKTENAPNNGSSAAKKKKKSGLRAFAVFVIAVLIFWWFNNFTLKTTRVEVLSSKIKAPIRIAVISDLHASSFGIKNKSIIRRLEKEDPDIVMILGDMYSLGSEQKDIDIALDLICGIKEKFDRVYFAPGEHDYYDPETVGANRYYYDEMEAHGVKIMDYKNEFIEVNGNKLQIMGIDNVHYTSTFDLTREFSIEEDCFNILLAHIPNYEKFAAFGADLTLCADTHGDMMQLPFGLGPLYDPDHSQWLPEVLLDQEVYDKGLFPYEGGAMFITSGIGASPAPIRFNNRPEVAVVEIKSK